MTIDVDEDVAAIDLARECLYRFLAAVLSDPGGARFPLALDETAQRLACQAADLLRSEVQPDPEGQALEGLSCSSIVESLGQPRDALAEEHRRVFGLSATVFPPFETEFFPNSEPFFRAQQLADVAGFYRAFGLMPVRGEAERVDHIALELEYLACLLSKRRLAASAEEQAVCENAAASFFRDHLGWWAPSLARGLEQKGAGGLYESIGRTLAAFVALERRAWPVETARIPLPEATIEQPDDASGCAACSA